MRFAVKIAARRGHVSGEDLRAVKLGYDDAQVIEIVLQVALNTWTNYINEVAETDIDFPVVSARNGARPCDGIPSCWITCTAPKGRGSCPKCLPLKA